MMKNLRKIVDSSEVAFKMRDEFGDEMLADVWAIDVQSMAIDGLASVRMAAYVNRRALDKTFLTGIATFWSRSRQGIWVKGEESGNFMPVRGVYADCDKDTLIYDVSPLGPTCHSGEQSCFQVADGEI